MQGIKMIKIRKINQKLIMGAVKKLNTLFLILLLILGSFAVLTQTLYVKADSTNLTPIPEEFTSTGGWFINGSEPTMVTYPVTKDGQTAIKVSPNANYQSTHSSDVSELDGININLSPNDVIDYSGYVYTDSSFFSGTKISSIGYTNIGISNGNWGADNKFVTGFQAQQDGVIHSISAYFRDNTGSGTTTMTYVIYSGNSTTPNTLLGSVQQSTVDDNTFYWHNITGLTVSVTGGSYYWLGMIAGSSIDVKYDTSLITGQSCYAWTDTLPVDNPFGEIGGLEDRIYNIYANYTINANSSKLGVLLGMDMYAGSNRICEIVTNNGSTYPTDTVGSITNAGCYIGANSGQWTYFNMHFTVRSTYLADSSNGGGYAEGTSHTPDNCIPFFCWVSWGVYDYRNETANFYVTNTTFTINNIVSPTPTPTPTSTPIINSGNGISNLFGFISSLDSTSQLIFIGAIAVFIILLGASVIKRRK
jgi:hypothetical protein